MCAIAANSLGVASLAASAAEACGLASALTSPPPESAPAIDCIASAIARLELDAVALFKSASWSFTATSWAVIASNSTLTLPLVRGLASCRRS